MAEKLTQCPWCGDEGEPLVCELSTKPRTFRVVCSNCGSGGPDGPSPEEATAEWNDRDSVRVHVDASPVESVEDLDQRIAALLEHAIALRDGIAAGDVDVERAVALGAASVIVNALHSLIGAEVDG